MNQYINTDSSAITDFPNLPKVREPLKTLPPLQVNGIAKVSSQISDSGVIVRINNKQIHLHYPPSIWVRFPKMHKKIFAQNLTYAMTFQLPFLYTTLKRMFYNMPIPLSEPFLFKGLSLALPSSAIMQTQKEKRITSDYLRRLFEIEYVYSGHKTQIPPYNRKSLSDHAIMPFTFGKDSLLTYALAREFGIKVHPVYISEPYQTYEEHVKKELSEPFRKEFHIQIGFLKNSLGVFREPEGWLGWELQLTQYSLMLLPYVYAKKAGYILFSNEQSCDLTSIDDDGFKFNPVFEQSHAWLLQNSLMTSIVGGNSLQIGSLLEPIHDLGILRILHHRYPEIGKYQTSCDMPNKPKGEGRWCENCTKCGRIYIMLLALGINPKSVGFKHDLLKNKYHHLYTVFSQDKIKDSGYDQSEAGKNEQILSFYMAYQLNIQGPVMKTFVRHFLTYARKHERILKQIFFGIHSTKTVPPALRPKLLRIYRQELDVMK